MARLVTLVNGLKAAATENEGHAEIMASAGDTFLAGKEFNASPARDDGASTTLTR